MSSSSEGNEGGVDFGALEPTDHDALYAEFLKASGKDKLLLLRQCKGNISTLSVEYLKSFQKEEKDPEKKSKFKKYIEEEKQYVKGQFNIFKLDTELGNIRNPTFNDNTQSYELADLLVNYRQFDGAGQIMKNRAFYCTLIIFSQWRLVRRKEIRSQNPKFGHKQVTDMIKSECLGITGYSYSYLDKRTSLIDLIKEYNGVIFCSSFTLLFENLTEFKSLLSFSETERTFWKADNVDVRISFDKTKLVSKKKRARADEAEDDVVAGGIARMDMEDGDNGEVEKFVDADDDL